ncbi:aminoglycoside 6'-N-acetyltransferase [Fusibacter sp. JL216-2]|uniref:aminoglycoside 6'-N-acetyltransferase n=1 Tax=Fusibacter sp. JL216-2 TaxID=3071453 RepID=UPI003D33402B
MIVQINHENIDACLKMGLNLWPDMDKIEFLEEIENAINSRTAPIFMYKKESGDHIGFIQLSIRNDYVEGTTSSPVAYIEGLYVEAAHRKTGVANELVEYAKSWGQSIGCIEMASDCEIENKASIDFHKRIGFHEANRIVCFVKPIEGD